MAMKITIQAKFLCLSLSLLFASCASLDNRIEDLSSNKYFKQAYKLLEKEELKISKNPSSKGIAVLEQSKSIYQNSIERYYGSIISNLKKQGKYRESLKNAKEAFSLCNWSKTIEGLYAELRSSVENLDRIQLDWSYEIQSKVIAEDRIELAQELFESINGQYQDSEALISLSLTLKDSILKRASTKIKTASLKSLTEYKDSILSDLQFSLSTHPEKENITKSFLWLIKKIDDSSTPFVELEKTYFQTIINFSKQDNSLPSVQVYYNSVKGVLEKWIIEDYSDSLINKSIHPDIIEYFENMLVDVPNLFKSKEYVDKLGLAHLYRAKQLIHGGIATSVGEVHLARSEELSNIYNSEILKLKDTARAYKTTVDYPTIPIRISIDPKINLSVQDTIYSIFTSSFFKESRHGRPWLLVEEPSDALVEINITSGEIYIPDYSTLSSTTSSYLSHYQNVANPAKSILEFQLKQAEYNVQSAKSNYNRAVQSHNYNPTSWSLSSVNSAYSTYQMAVNNYNSLVTSYNLTPSTISQPVFLPYIYREGTLRIGFAIGLAVRIGNLNYTISKQSLQSGYVRTGTKPTDKNPEYRKDINLTFSIGVDSLLSHIQNVNKQVTNSLYNYFSELSFNTTDELSEYEKRVLNLIFHPFGYQKDKAASFMIPAYYISQLENISKDSSSSFPRIVLEKSQDSKKKYVDIKDMVKNNEKYIVLIKNYKSGELYSIGSGALVGPNGLILTCAHVLRTSDIRISFVGDSKNTEYQIEIIYSNEKEDVALIQATNLQNKGWMNIRLVGNTVKGEKIISIGNPSLGSAGINIGGLSQGIISNPLLSIQDQKYLVADITIASGSSGGPMISIDTNEIVGVVQAVTSAGIDESGVAASGFFALAAPSQVLTDWLGLTYK